MRTVLKKTLVAILCLTFAFSPAVATVKTAQAASFSDYGGEIATTALGCFGILDKVSSALTGLTDSILTAGAQPVPVKSASADSKENCLDAIAYTAAKIVLAKITKSTLVWINSGFDGSPTFVQDPGSFFLSIANEQVTSFTAKIAFDPTRFPFGRVSAQNIIQTIQGQLDYNASVSSGRLLNHDNNANTPYAVRFEAFTNDFLYGGGWDGYLAVTQITNANPFDSYIEEVNSIGPVINKANIAKNPVVAISKELQESSGFLALKKCVNPTYYTPPSSDPSFTRAQAEAQAQNDPFDEDTVNATFWLDQHTCKRFETQTPGTAIADQMKISLGTSKEQLALADELNESISAVFDALLSQLFSKGVASLSGEDDVTTGNVSVLGGYGTNTSSSTLSGSGGYSAGATQWYNQNKNFDLKEAISPGGVIDDPDCHFQYATDLAATNPSPGNVPTGIIMNPDALTDPDCNQGYAVVQLAYGEALQAQNIKLQEALRWIGYADYCLPGPRPDWYQSAISAVSGLQERFNEIAQEDDEEDRAHHSYAELKYFTGFAAKYDEVSVLRNPSNSFNAIYQALSEKIGGWGYKQYIEDRYDINSPTMPVIGPLINQEYAKKYHYQSVIEQNLTAIAEARAMFLRMQNIETNIIEARNTYAVGTPAENTVAYQQFMDNQLKVFSRLIAQIKTIDSVENVISDTSLAEDEIKYLADPVTGIIKSCITQTAAMNSYPTTGPYAYKTRRPYPVSLKANTTDFSFRGWGTDPLAGYQPQLSFLPDISISASSQTATDIYIGHYVNSCAANPAGPSSPFKIKLSGNADYALCLDGDSELTSTTGDRFEAHLNSY